MTEGLDIASLEVRALAGLPAPWRIRFRLRAGTITIDGTSAEHCEMHAWNRDETVGVLAAALMGRFAGKALDRVDRWAADRVKNGARGPLDGGRGGARPLSWIEISDLSGDGPEAWWHLIDREFPLYRAERAGTTPFGVVVGPTVGEAVRRLGGQIVGAWSGDAAEVAAPKKRAKKPRGAR